MKIKFLVGVQGVFLLLAGFFVTCYGVTTVALFFLADKYGWLSDEVFCWQRISHGLGGLTFIAVIVALAAGRWAIDAIEGTRYK